MKKAFSTYGLSYKYSNKDIINDITLELHYGECLSIIGPNGSGKSTFLKSISGIIPLDRKHSSGHIRLGNRLINNMNQSDISDEISYVGVLKQNGFGIKVIDYVSMPIFISNEAKFYNLKGINLDRVHWPMDICDCRFLREKSIDSLSMGELQRVHLAMALVKKSKIIIMDETLSFMDQNYQYSILKKLKKFINDKEYALIVVSHDINISTIIATHVAFIKNGSLISFGDKKKTFNIEEIKKLYECAYFKEFYSNKDKLIGFSSL